MHSFIFGLSLHAPLKRIPFLSLGSVLSKRGQSGDKFTRFLPATLGSFHVESHCVPRGLYSRERYFHSKALVPRWSRSNECSRSGSTACNFSAWNPHRSCSSACERFINRKLYENPNRPLFKRADGTNDAFSMLSCKRWHNSDLSPPLYTFIHSNSYGNLYFLHVFFTVNEYGG